LGGDARLRDRGAGRLQTFLRLLLLDLFLFLDLGKAEIDLPSDQNERG
jgi:hypothetical protein